MTLTKEEAAFIASAIEQALVEIEACTDISQGVEDDLSQALDILSEVMLEDDNA